MADADLTVVLSSHLLADVERVCDHLVVLDGGACGWPATSTTCSPGTGCSPGARRTPAAAAGQHVVQASHTERQSRLLVRTDEPVHDPAWTVEDVGLEDLVLAYMAGERGRARPLAEANG